MTVPTDIKHIVRDPNFYGGKPCIDTFKISVHDIAIRYNQGYTPEQMTTELYPELSLAQVYAALLYYAEHKEEIDRQIAEEAADIKARAAADMSPLAQRIRAAIAERKRQLGVEDA
ncbi:MAG TPA: DUF433 domain-containing protein [Ktedonobacterales bacterium]